MNPSAEKRSNHAFDSLLPCTRAAAFKRSLILIHCRTKLFGQFGNRLVIGNPKPREQTQGNGRFAAPASNNGQVKSRRNGQQDVFKPKKGTNNSEKGGASLPTLAEKVINSMAFKPS